MEAKGIFFDLCGTLLIYGDMSKAWAEWQLAIYCSLKECGMSLTEEAFTMHCNGLLERPDPFIQNDNLTILERRILSLGESVGLNLKTCRIKETAQASIEAWSKYLTLDSDAIPILQSLKQEQYIGLITNFDHPPYIYSILTELNIINLFDTIIISGEVGIKKPNPKIFSLALEECGLQPHDVVYVGDTREDDVNGALAAKIRPILIDRDNRVTSVRDEVIDRSIEYSDDFQIIKKLGDLMTI
jgi:HAD superfamily hydrolase (TIGR01549 family)